MPTSEPDGMRLQIRENGQSKYSQEGVKLLTVKIRVSYEHPEELERLKKRLGQDVKKIKAPKQQEGKFRKAYIELKE